MATVRKIYLDSRFCLPGGKGSNFTYELGQTVQCGPNCVGYVCDVCLPVSWPTIGANNQMLYMIERSLDGTTAQGRIFTVPPGSYNAATLATAIQTALNGAGNPSTGLGGTYTVTYDADANKYTFSNPAIGFQLVDEYHLDQHYGWQTEWQWTGTGLKPNGPTYDYRNPRYINHMLGVPSLKGSSVDYWPYASSVTLGVLDLRSVHSVYIHSDALSTFNVVTPSGAPNCIRRVPVALSFGEVIHEGFSVSPFDCLELHDVTLKTIDVKLLDVYGRELDLQGGHISFSVVLSEKA